MGRRNSTARRQLDRGIRRRGNMMLYLVPFSRPMNLPTLLKLTSPGANSTCKPDVRVDQVLSPASWHPQRPPKHVASLSETGAETLVDSAPLYAAGSRRKPNFYWRSSNRICLASHRRE